MSNVEICIPTNKEAVELGRTLSSLNESAENCNTTIDVLLVYNGISINPISHGSKYQNLKIRTVTSRRHALSAARNTALHYSSSDWIAFIDDDIVCAKDYVENLLRELIGARPNDAIAGRITLLQQEDLPLWAGKVCKTLMCDFDLGKKRFHLDSPGVGANFAIHRDFAMKLGGFNESLGRMGNLLLSNEDTDYFMKHLKHGGKVVYCGGIQVFHEFHPARSEYSWMIERMAWQGTSDVVMGTGITLSELTSSIEKANLPGLGIELHKLLAPATGISEFEARLNVVRNLQVALSTFSKIEIDKTSHVGPAFKSYMMPNEYLQSEVLNSEVIFVEFENNHPGNYEYVYSKLERSTVHRTKNNPWVNPTSTANELRDWVNRYKPQEKTIVFLTTDPIFWNHTVFKESIEELSESNRLIGYIHRTNIEIQTGVNRLGQKFRSLLMYGFTGPKIISDRWNVEVIPSPIPSFIESHFSELQDFETDKTQKYNFGLIGEFRIEKSYSYFMKKMRQFDITRSTILMAGRSVDNSQQILKCKLQSLNSNVSVLEKDKAHLLEFDRNFFSQLNNVEVFVSGYSRVHEIAASGPIAESLFLGKQILIDPETWIHEDLLIYVPEALFDFGAELHQIQDSNRMKLVSSVGALNRLREAISNSV
jgi:glycosyltransferase involved in cell wall biosynthesis